MTDKDIVKALECCSMRSGEACSECPYHQYYDGCIAKRNADITGLINRQRAEIEEKSNKLREVLPIVAELKAEAIKEFAERLHKEFSQCQREYRNVLNSDGACAMIIANKVVDNLVKELTEKGGGEE